MHRIFEELPWIRCVAKGIRDIVAKHLVERDVYEYDRAFRLATRRSCLTKHKEITSLSRDLHRIESAPTIRWSFGG